CPPRLPAGKYQEVGNRLEFLQGRTRFQGRNDLSKSSFTLTVDHIHVCADVIEDHFQRVRQLASLEVGRIWSTDDDLCVGRSFADKIDNLLHWRCLKIEGRGDRDRERLIPQQLI